MSLFDELNTVSDVQGLIDQKVDESDTLEYKTAPDQMQQSDKLKAAKALSAFANSGGGLLIYGVATKDKTNPTRPTKVEPISAFNEQYLRKHARDGVRHPIPGIRPKSIPVDGDRYIVLFDVPESPLAPHQLVDEAVYYRRQDAHSVKMPHDLVELYFGRRLQAILEPTLELVLLDKPRDGQLRLRVTLGILNLGGQVGRDVMTRILVADPNRVRIDALVGTYISRVMAIDLSKDEIGLAHQHLAELYYPGVAKRFIAFDIYANQLAVGRRHVLFYFDSYAADSRPRRYELFLLAENGDVVLHSEAGGIPALKG